MAIRKNLTSADTHTLIQKGSSEKGNLSKILITNSDNTTSNNVTIQLNDGAGSPTTYQIFRAEMPAQTSIVLEDGITFQSSLFRLEAITDASAKITIIIE